MTHITLIAAREFTERLRSRTFLVSNGVVLLLIILSVGLPVLLEDDSPTRLGVVGDAAATVADVAVARQDSFDVELEVVPVPDLDAAEAAVADDELDLALLDGSTVLVERSLDGPLESLLNSARSTAEIDARLAAAGLDPDERAELFAVAPLEVRTRSDDGEDAGLSGPAVLVSFAGVFVLYGLLVLYGQWVAQGIVEEKQSRVVEVLLSTVRPTELLAGKIIGLGLLGLAQLLIIAAVGLAGLLLTDGVTLPSSGYGGLGLVIAWYVPGYLLYATLFAMAGAVVSRVEDLQSAVMPVILVLVLALFGAQIALSDPTTTLAAVAGILPLTAPMVQPVLAASGEASVWHMLLAFVLAIAAIAGLVPLTARIYRGGVLSTRGRVKLREAWGGTRSS